MERFAVQYIAVCERVLGVVFALYAVGGFAFGIISKEPSRAVSILLGFVALAMMGGPAVLCFATAAAIIRRARWSWFSSVAIGILIGVIGAGCVCFYISPQPASGHRGMGFFLFLGIFLLLLSVAGFILLSLPIVWRSMKPSAARQESIPMG